MNTAVLFETLMLILFGCSWPFNIKKSLTSRTTLGKSVTFEMIIIVGYICGVIAKLIIWKRDGVLQYSFWVYLLDIALVSTDICIYFRNLKLDKASGKIK